MIAFKQIHHHPVLVSIVCASLATVLCYQNLVFYLIPNTSLFVFLGISPFVFRIQKEEKKVRYAWISLLFLVLYFFLKMQLLFFLSFASFIMFTIESNLGKVNSLPLFIILLISPYSSFIFNVFGFPVRLGLTKIAVSILSFVFNDVASHGNNILIHQQRFSVEPECMGLTMVGYGYATTLLFINHMERKFERKLRIPQIVGILLMSTFFIVLVNLFRIVISVILQSRPATVTHELLGLLSFGLYFMIPIYFWTKWVVKRVKRVKKIYSAQTDGIKEPLIPHPSFRLRVSLTVVLLTALTYFNLNRSHFRNIQLDPQSEKVELAGYSKSITQNKVIKFENAHALIYIKPSCHFFGPDHSPTICWKGSGYAFKNIKTQKVDSIEIYTAELKKGNEILQTAWWFDNGKEKTISQLEWRWKTAWGDEPYRLVNITAISKEELDSQIRSMIQMNLFN